MNYFSVRTQSDGRWMITNQGRYAHDRGRPACNRRTLNGPALLHCHPGGERSGRRLPRTWTFHHSANPGTWWKQTLTAWSTFKLSRSGQFCHRLQFRIRPGPVGTVGPAGRPACSHECVETEEKTAESRSALRGLRCDERLDFRVLGVDVTSTSSVDSAAARVLRSPGPRDVRQSNNAGQMFVGIHGSLPRADGVLPAARHQNGGGGSTGWNRAFPALPCGKRRQAASIVQMRLPLPAAFGGPFLFGGVTTPQAKWGAGRLLHGAPGGVWRGRPVSMWWSCEPGPFTTALFPSSPRPEDVDGRVGTYPPIAHQTFQGMGAAFEGDLSRTRTCPQPIRSGS